MAGPTLVVVCLKSVPLGAVAINKFQYYITTPFLNNALSLDVTSFNNLER